MECWVLGDAALDCITIGSAERAEERQGGAAANVAAGLARHGRAVRLVSAVGADAAGAAVQAALARLGIGVEARADLPTRRLEIGVSADGSRVRLLTPETADMAAVAAFQGGGPAPAMIYTSGTVLLHTAAYEAAARLFEQAPPAALRAFDSNIRVGSASDAPQRIARFRRMAAQADVLKLGRREWTEFLGAADPQRLLAAFGLKLLVLTDAGQGATLYAPGGAAQLGAAPAACLDPTGAGDAFLARLLASVLEAGGRPALEAAGGAALERWGRPAAAWAARITERVGATTAYLE